MQRVIDYCRRYGLWIALAVAFVVRVAILKAMPQPMVSDALAYVHMANNAAHGQPMTDTFGQHAFYSPGYPLLLAAPFAVFGSSLGVAQGVNLICALVLIALVFALTKRVTADMLAPTLAALGMAVWIPNALIVETVAKENLSTPLLVAFVLGVLHLRSERHLARHALGLGLIYGVSLLVGGSVLLTALGVGVMLIAWRTPLRVKATACALFGLGALLVLAPWLIYVKNALGVAMLSSNAPFNLYLGNNPHATGWFMSISDTPLGPRWHALSAQLGEAGTAAYLQHEAVGYVAAHPVSTVVLGFKKLLYFWLPNVPSAASVAGNTKLIVARYADIAEYAAVVGLAGFAIVRARLAPLARPVLCASVIGFWLIHALTYIIPRYRDPVMPLLIVLAAAMLSQWFAPTPAEWIKNES